MSTVSKVSETDVRLFLSLANPESVDTSANISDVIKQIRSTPKFEQTCITEGVSGGGGDSRDTHARIKEESESDSLSSSAGDAESTTCSEESFDSKVRYEDLAKLAQPAGRETESVQRRVSKAPSQTSFSSKVQQEKSNTFVPQNSYYSSRPAFPEAPPVAFSAQRPTMTKEEEEDVLLEKQSVLLELERLRRQNIVLSKEYTMNDRLEDMQFEVRRHLLNIDEQNTLQFMRDGLRLFFTGIEIANSQFGPFLDLDGWAASVGGDIEKYDSALSRMYRKYWRRSTMSPEMELTVGILGSIGMHHFQKKMMGNIIKGATKEKNKKNKEPVVNAKASDSSDEEDLPEDFK